MFEITECGGRCGDMCPKTPGNQEKVEGIMVAACIGQEPEKMQPKGKIVGRVKERLSEQGIKPCVTCAELVKYKNLNEQIQQDYPALFKILKAEKKAFKQLVQSVLSKPEESSEINIDEALKEVGGVIDRDDIELMLPGESPEIRAIIGKVCNNLGDFCHDLYTVPHESSKAERVVT